MSMVANLTLGKAKYADFQELAENTAAKAHALVHELTDCVRKDMTAFDGVIAAFKLPKGSEERSRAVQEAYKAATGAPVETAEKCLEVMRLAEGLLHKSNVTAAVALEARAGILIALENVGVNLAAIRDEEYVKEWRAWSDNIDAESQKLLDVVRAGAAEMTGGR